MSEGPSLCQTGMCLGHSSALALSFEIKVGSTVSPPPSWFHPLHIGPSRLWPRDYESLEPEEARWLGNIEGSEKCTWGLINIPFGLQMTMGNFSDLSETYQTV